MADETIWDVIVVGAGIVGSCTAYHSARSGDRTLLLEQFHLPHTRGSSHGATRMMWKTYDNVLFAEMIDDAYAAWADLEKESNTKLYKQTGLLVIGDKNSTYMKNSHNTMTSQGIPFEDISHNALCEKYPMIQYPENIIGILDPNAGTLYAHKALAVILKQIQRHGGHIHDGEPVMKIDPGEIIRIETSKAKYRTKSLVLAPGAWAKRLLASVGVDLPVTIVKANVYYWRETVAGAYSSEHFPVFDYEGGARRDQKIYGFPSDEYPGMIKLYTDEGPVIDPDARDKPSDAYVGNMMRAHVREHFPYLDPEPCIHESCIKTRSADVNFYLDRHPKWKNIIIGAGMSGQGFKMGPVVGKILSDMAKNIAPKYDIHQFRIDRFKTKSSL